MKTARFTLRLQKIHPWAKLAWGIVSAAYKVRGGDYLHRFFFYIPRHQVVQAQVALDDDVKNLIDEMDKSCKIADEGAPLKKYSPRFNEILEKLLVQVSECAYFVIDYCREKSFGTCSGSYYLYLPLTGDMFSWASLKVLNLRCQSPSGWLHHQSKGVV